MKNEIEPRLVVLGGGTGLSMLLRGLKNYTEKLTAIVTVSDDGGSSGRLRRELGMMPPGDIRRCLVALASRESLMEQVIQYRFQQGEGLQGHTLGNLLLTVMTEITGDFMTAVTEVSKILAVRGRVLPAALQMVTLGAEMGDGQVVHGETAIRNYHAPIKRIFIEPGAVDPPSEALQAIAEADLIIMGPGSLFTSVVPNLMVPAIKAAVIAANCPRVYVCNIMTEHGETDGFSVADHLKVIYRHVEQPCLDYVIVNNRAITEEVAQRYALEEAYPVTYFEPAVEVMNIKPVLADLLGEGVLAWHDSERLSRVLVGLLATAKGVKGS
ncbi:MAG: gluconeogenesis factor YvcK family protein [Methylocystaceae bacterium]